MVWIKTQFLVSRFERKSILKTPDLGTAFRQVPYTFHIQWWEMRLETDEWACAGSTSEAKLWVKEVETSVGALDKFIQNFYFKKKVDLEEQKRLLQERVLRGRQIAFVIWEYFRVAGAQGTVFDHSELFILTLRKMKFRNAIRSGTKFYCQRISQAHDQKLNFIVKRSIDQRIRSRNFEARTKKIETGEVVKNRRD